MATAAPPTSGLYVYAIVTGDQTVDYGPIGIEGAKVYRIAGDQMTALVSHCAQSKLRPERRNVAAHNAVLKQALEEDSVLPMAFGLIASDETAIQELLSRNRRTLREQLLRVAGKVEMGLRVQWEVPNVFEFLVNTHPDLREARDAVGSVRQARQSDLLSLGQLFERIQTDERDGHFAKVESVMGKHDVELKRNPPRSEREVMNLACLISRQQLAAFDSVVGEAAAAFDNNYTFNISGPWAAHNFVSLSLKV